MKIAVFLYKSANEWEGWETTLRRHASPWQQKKILCSELPNFDIVFCVAPVHKAIVRDVTFPAPLQGNKRISALEYAIENFLPVELASCYWGYCVLNSNPATFRWYTMDRSAADEFLLAAENSGIRCDYFLFPEIVTGEEFPEYDGNALLSQIEEICRTKRLEWQPQEWLPGSMRIVRHKLWQRASTFVLLFLLVVVSAVFARKWQNVQVQLELLGDRQTQMNTQLRLFEEVHKKLQSGHERLKAIESYGAGNSSVSFFLRDIAQNLPPEMWIQNLNCRDNGIELDVLSSKPNPDLYRHLSAPANWKILSLRQNQWGKELLRYFMKLEISYP